MKSKKILSAFLAGVMIISSVLLLSACGENTSQDSSQSDQSSKAEGTTQETARKEFDFSKIEWTINKEREYGKSIQVIEFTNNSDFSILEIKLTFEQKSGTTEEDLKVFDELAKKENIEDVSDIYIVANCYKLIKQGESETGSLLINNSYKVQKEEQFSIMEPSQLELVYSDGEKIYGVEYNYSSKKIKKEAEPKPAYDWTTTALGDQIPKLNCEITSVVYDEQKLFKVIGFDYSQSMTDEYIEECKKIGYTIDDDTGSTKELKKDDYKLEIYYEEDSKEISVKLETDKPIEATTKKATQ